jgi:hypothetical protein
MSAEIAISRIESWLYSRRRMGIALRFLMQKVS